MLWGFGGLFTRSRTESEKSPILFHLSHPTPYYPPLPPSLLAPLLGLKTTEGREGGRAHRSKRRVGSVTMTTLPAPPTHYCQGRCFPTYSGQPPAAANLIIIPDSQRKWRSFGFLFGTKTIFWQSTTFIQSPKSVCSQLYYDSSRPCNKPSQDCARTPKSNFNTVWSIVITIHK